MNRSIVLALAFALVPMAHAAEMKMHHGAATTPAGHGYRAAMNKMMHSQGMTPTGDADVDFMAMMIPHHQAAVDMAEVALKYAKDPDVLRLARAVVDTQGREINEMRAWQAKHVR